MILTCCAMADFVVDVVVVCDGAVNDCEEGTS